MGMSLCNLQIYNPERKEYKIKEGYILSHVVEGWDTVMECDGKYDLYRLARLARELSSELNTPVVSVYYFDDDEFELTSTVYGKKAASFSLGHLGRSSKKLSDLIQSLRLDDNDAKVFRYLTRKDMYADEAIGEFSAVCNLPFYLYPEMKTFDQIPAELIENKKRILDEIKKEKSRNKEKNRKAELLFENPGDVVNYHTSQSSSDRHKGIIRMLEPDEDGLDYSKVHCYQVTDGVVPGLKKVHDYRIPIQEITGAPKDTNIWIRISKRPAWDGYEPITWTDELVFLQPPCYCHYSTEDGEEIAQIGNFGIIPEEKLSDSSYLFGDEESKITVKLQGEFEPGFNYVPVKDRFGKDTTTWEIKKVGDTIVKISTYDRDFARFDFGNKEGELTETVLFDKAQSHCDFPYLYSDFTYLNEDRKIIYGNAVFDLNDKTISVNDSIPVKNIFIDNRSIRGKILLIVGTSRNIQVFDLQLNLLASYPVKGKCVKWFYDGEDNMYVITSSIIHGEDNRGMKREDKVRMYKIPLCD